MVRRYVSEYFIVIGVVVMLNLILLAIFNPMEQFAKARNTQREIHIQILSDVIQYYMADHQGRLIPGMDNTWQMIGTDESCLDLTDYLVSNYISAIPYDPKFGSPEKTYYAVKISSANRVIIQARGTE